MERPAGEDCDDRNIDGLPVVDVRSLARVSMCILTDYYSYDSFKVYLGLPTTGGH